MHILLIHQAFAALDEPGGTRHHELARYLVAHGHTVTVIASPVSYLTGTTSTLSPQIRRIWGEPEGGQVRLHLPCPAQILCPPCIFFPVVHGLVFFGGLAREKC